jgi:hypothetical protein
MKQVSSRTIYFYKIRGFKQIYALVLAILPLFSSIVVPFTNQSISYVLCYIMFPFLVWRLSLKKIFSKNLIFVYAFFIYFMIRVEGDWIHYFLFSVVVTMNILAVYNNQADIIFLFNTIFIISVLATFFIILQILCYYIFHFHLQLLDSNFIMEHLRDSYDFLFRFGVNNGTYRPSSFFFEPSQMCQYCFIGLMYSLYQWGKNKKSIGFGLFISLGMILTTSSQGIVLVIGCWLWGIFVKGDRQLMSRILKLLFAMGVLAFIIWVMYRLNLFNMSMILNRIFSDYNGYNAIGGRTFAAGWYLTNLSGNQKIFGVGYVNRPDVYMTGAILYRYTMGYVGILLYYLMLIFSIRKLSRMSTVVAVGTGGLFAIASITSLIPMIFYLSLSYAGFAEKEQIHE